MFAIVYNSLQFFQVFFLQNMGILNGFLKLLETIKVYPLFLPRRRNDFRRV